MAHTKGVESFWAMLKRGYKRTYHEMSVKDLARYMETFPGRHNVPDLDTLAQRVALVRDVEGHSLWYVDLVNDNG